MQTCFCCVLEMQHVEGGAVLQHCRRDELAAEMLKVLTIPFMVRSTRVSHHNLLQFTCFCISNRIVLSFSLLLLPPAMSRSLQAGLDDQNHSAKTCARMLKGCFRSSFPFAANVLPFCVLKRDLVGYIALLCCTSRQALPCHSRLKLQAHWKRWLHR